MLTRNDLKISTDALLALGVSGGTCGVCILRGALTVFSRELYRSSSANVVRVDGVGWSPRYDRDASVVPVIDVGGEVGDGIFGEGYDGDTVLELDPFTAARCDDDSTALSAALAGSSVCTMIDRSCDV